MTPRLPAHVSVLPAETLELLAPHPGEVWADCTTGGGGHARLIAERIAPGGRLLALDQDPAMLELAGGRLAGLSGTSVELVHANFDQLAEVLEKQGVGQVNGVLADIGFSSDQLMSPTCTS